MHRPIPPLYLIRRTWMLLLAGLTGILMVKGYEGWGLLAALGASYESWQLVEAVRRER